jgi:hypothetical protein
MWRISPARGVDVDSGDVVDEVQGGRYAAFEAAKTG